MRLRIVAGCSLSLLLVDVVPITAQQQRPPLTCEQRQQRVNEPDGAGGGAQSQLHVRDRWGPRGGVLGLRSGTRPATGERTPA